MKVAQWVVMLAEQKARKKVDSRAARTAAVLVDWLVEKTDVKRAEEMVQTTAVWSAE